MPIVGEAAPDFALFDQEDREISLQDYRGRWVVLYFYPKDNTPGCTIQACDFTEQFPLFTQLDAVVLGCSPDSTESHRKFIEKRDLGITLLSDPEKKVMEAYEAWGEKKLYGKVSIGVIRSTVIIDPEGKVAHRWRRVKTKGHADKVREKLAVLQPST